MFGRLTKRPSKPTDKTIRLDLSEVALDTAQHKAPSGGAGTGEAPSTGETRLQGIACHRRERHPRRVVR